MNTSKSKSLQESIDDLEKLKKLQEKSLNIKAARMTQMTIDALKQRLKGEKNGKK